MKFHAIEEVFWYTAKKIMTFSIVCNNVRNRILRELLAGRWLRMKDKYM